MWKILSDRNWVMMPNGCEKLSDEWWVMSDEWRKLSDEISLAKQALKFFVFMNPRHFLLTLPQGLLALPTTRQAWGLWGELTGSVLITIWYLARSQRSIWHGFAHSLLPRTKVSFFNYISDFSFFFFLFYLFVYTTY